MKKKLIIYRWGATTEPQFIREAQALGWDCAEFAWEKVKDYHYDTGLASGLMMKAALEKAQAVFSYDYFPVVSMVCQARKIPYLSWIYDCPHSTLYSRTLASPYNYIFCFDRLYTERLRAMGALHAEHLPLCGTPEALKEIESWREQKPAEMARRRCGISFAGSLYNEQKNRLRRAELTPWAAGYVEGLIQAQLNVYGMNFLAESLSEEVTREIAEKCQLKLGDDFISDTRQMAADAVAIEVTAREREMALERISREHSLILYTTSELPDSLRGNANIEVRGYEDYRMIFGNSGINLNITLKSIQSGIPLRVFDILSCGGFCLTNYQPEIAEYFADGEELVMYGSMEDLARKAGYYLEHPGERAEIAENGYQRIVSDFSLKNQAAKLLASLE